MAMPRQGKPVEITAWVDADHAGDKSLRRSRTGFFIYLNSALISWLSKRQPTIETSVFGAEFVAMKHCMETLRGLRYKLRMMGIPLAGPSYVYGDNLSVIKNCSKPESQLNKKSLSICYHAVREAVAMDELLISHIASGDNRADLATKILTDGIKRSKHVDTLLYDIESQSKLPVDDETAAKDRPALVVRKVIKVPLSGKDEYTIPNADEKKRKRVTFASTTKTTTYKKKKS